MSKLESTGDSSLDNGLGLVYGYLNEILSCSHREVLILYLALPTCDPGDIMETIQKCKKSKIKVICGAQFIKMGFPLRAAEGPILFCACHKEVKLGGGYTFPRCKARTECQICVLTLVLLPHLGRLYPHLFPITPFNEVSAMSISNSTRSLPRACFGCQQTLPLLGNSFVLTDIYIHDSLHNCWGCGCLANLHFDHIFWWFHWRFINPRVLSIYSGPNIFQLKVCFEIKL
ncbi:General transcription factor IIH subunit 2 [Ranunculus cassubicifolius]